MQAVSQGASQDVLRTVDRLIGEGHSPTHFARQLVRFLRNTIVAKVAGGDSSLLQISSDERQRVARVAEMFSEEDLARHLQIMLRTHGEIGYRQEQRFHLELGLLKMTHAQRLIPIEQLLSEAGVASSGPARPAGKPSVVPDAKRVESPAATRTNAVSPFAADSARKTGSKPEMSVENTGPRPVANPPAGPSVVMGSAAPAEPELKAAVVPDAGINDDSLRSAVLNALSGHRMLASMLDGGEWRVEGNELLIQVSASNTVIDMSLGADARRLIIASASGALGRAVKLKVISGGTAQPAASRPASNGGGRSRAEQDPVVRRMKDKFGAEIRTIIDYREKR
jgi:DNA polymerase-3 subunit gamma/tau